MTLKRLSDDTNLDRSLLTFSPIFEAPSYLYEELDSAEGQWMYVNKIESTDRRS